MLLNVVCSEIPARGRNDVIVYGDGIELELLHRPQELMKRDSENTREGHRGWKLRMTLLFFWSQ